MIRPLSIFLTIAMIGFNIAMLFPCTARYVIQSLVIATAVASIFGFSKTVSMLRKFWRGEWRHHQEVKRTDRWEIAFYVAFLCAIITACIKILY